MQFTIFACKLLRHSFHIGFLFSYFYFFFYNSSFGYGALAHAIVIFAVIAVVIAFFVLF